MRHISPELKEQLRKAAEEEAENHRIALYGPGGGRKNAKAEQSLYWKALKAIEFLERGEIALDSRHRENPLYWYRTGVIRFTEAFLLSLNNETRRKVFGELIPLEMTYDQVTQTHTLKAASWKFRETIGDELPEYMVIIDHEPDGTHIFTWKERL